MKAEPSLVDVVKLLESIQQQINELKSSQTRPRKPKLLLSLREAAARLGVDRNTTLHDLIGLGLLKTVEANGKTKVPATEVERLATEGFQTEGVGKPRKKARKQQPDEPSWDAVRAFKLKP